MNVCDDEDEMNFDVSMRSVEMAYKCFFLNEMK